MWALATPSAVSPPFCAGEPTTAGIRGAQHPQHGATHYTNLLALSGKSRNKGMPLQHSSQEALINIRDPSADSRIRALPPPPPATLTRCYPSALARFQRSRQVAHSRSARAIFSLSPLLDRECARAAVQSLLALTPHRHCALARGECRGATVMEEARLGGWSC